MAPNTDPLSRPLALPCGVKLPGRIVKAAMTEGLSDEWGRATQDHVRLYSQWSRGHGAGHVLITGNVGVDRRYPERPGNVCIDGPQTEEQLARLRGYAAAAKLDGTMAFVQLAHAGRQTNQMVNNSPVGPSPIAVQVAGASGAFSVPRELTIDELHDVSKRFAEAALVCKKVGFDGVQIHAAHGYLISSFMSPKANKRTDEYGGSLENRARLLVETVRTVRKAVGSHYPISVKLNSSDFSKGGFEPEECVQVALMLEKESVDLLELSGGNYEQPAIILGPSGLDDMLKLSALGKISSSQLREGYFLVFAEQLKKAVKHMPLMVTGGFRTRRAMEAALEAGSLDAVGLARPTVVDPGCVGKLLRGEITELPRHEAMVDLPWYLRWLRYIIVGNLMKSGVEMLVCYRVLVELGAERKTGRVYDRDPLLASYQLAVHDTEQAEKLMGLPDTIGLVHNAPPKVFTMKRVALIVTLVAALGLWRRFK